MNQPTREEFNELKESHRQLEEEVRRLKEQRTDEMKAINVNVASADVIARIDKLEQDLNMHSNAWIDTLQEHYEEHKQDISDVQTVLRGHSKYFEGHGKRLAATTTKDDLDKLRSEMATKEDLTTMATKDDIASIKATQEQILALLQQKS